MTAGKERMEVHFEGDVQGVGFRYTTLNLASRFAVVGYVMNLQDGRVRLVSVGEPPENQRLLEAIRQRMAAHIRTVDVVQGGPTDEFDRFEIRRF